MQTSGYWNATAHFTRFHLWRRPLPSSCQGCAADLPSLSNLAISIFDCQARIKNSPEANPNASLNLNLRYYYKTCACNPKDSCNFPLNLRQSSFDVAESSQVVRPSEAIWKMDCSWIWMAGSLGWLWILATRFQWWHLSVSWKALNLN